MADKNEDKTESSSSSSSTVSKTSGSNHDPLAHRNEIDEESDHSSERESQSLRNSLVNTVATIQNNFFKEGKVLETWHQFLLNKVLYNKDYTFVDESFCFIEHKTMVKREQVCFLEIIECEANEKCFGM